MMVVSLSQLVNDLDQLKKILAKKENERKHLYALVEVGRTINSSLDITAVLRTVMDTIIRMTGAERSFLMLKDEHGDLSLRVGRNWEQANLNEADAALSTTIVNRVAKGGRPVLTNNAQEDPRFGSLQSISNYNLRSILCVPLLIKNRVLGVIYADNRIQTSLFTEADGVMLSAFANQAAVAIENATLFDQVQGSTQDVMEAYDATIQGWAKALEFRDYETEGHCQRVTDLTVRLAKEMSIPDEDLVHIRRGAILHDVGKMGISDHILLKPGPLTEDEWIIIRKHPEYGYELLKPIKFLKPALDIVRYHHERWDGKGYPKGLKGREIPLSARMFSVVDVWDALVHLRPYKKPWSVDEALFYIQSQSGDFFDPSVIQAFLNFIRTYDQYPQLVV